MMKKWILPEYPDVEDKPGKRVVIKLDACSGRTELSNPNNRDARALKKSGVSFYMGIPNGSGTQQEEDEIFGEYQMQCDDNKDMIVRDRNKAVMMLQVSRQAYEASAAAALATGISGWTQRSEERPT